jgi:hypothetical protein
VARRTIPVGLVLAAALADATGRHGLAVYALLAAVPAVSVAALSALGDLLDADEPLARDGIPALQALLWGAAVCAVVLAAATRPLVYTAAGVTALGSTGLIACLTALTLESVVALALLTREGALELEPEPLAEGQ